MLARSFFAVAAFALGIAAAAAQTPPGQGPAIPGSPKTGTLAPSGTASSGLPPAPLPYPGSRPGPAVRGGGLGQVPQNLQQNGAETRRIQSETDELYREIMRRSAPPAQR
jgi:hypothetical protein